MNIVGNTIRLRPMEKRDMECRVKWFNDPDVNETLFLDAELNLEKTLDWFDKAVRDETR